MMISIHAKNISVIICTFNRCDSLRLVLADLRNQVLPPNVSYEVLVVDNNSSDETKAVVEDAIESTPGLFRYHFEEQQGKTYALNSGIENACGKILVFTDDDVVIPDDWLKNIFQAVTIHPDCRAFGGKIVPFFPGKIPSWIVLEGPFKITGAPLGDYDQGNEVKSCHEPMMNVPCGANMFFHRSVFEDCGYFNESLNNRVKKSPMGEDTEFCTKLMQFGEDILYIPTVVVLHRISDRQMTKGYFIKYSFKCGRSAAMRYEMSVMQRRLFNVPGYLYKTLIDKLLAYLKAVLVFDQQKMMFTLMSLTHYSGIFFEFLLGNRNHNRDNH